MRDKIFISECFSENAELLSYSLEEHHGLLKTEMQQQRVLN